MATAQNLFDSAVEMSNLNDPDLVDSTEWLRWISTMERRAFLVAARENPNYFGREGNTSARAFEGTWSLTTAPGNVAAVSKVEISAIVGTVSGRSVGDEVYITDIRRPWTAAAPRVYLRNKVLREYSSELSTDSSNYVSTLKVFYSYLPPRRTATSDSLDIPEEHEDLVVLPMAARLALRDQRPEEAALLQQLAEQEWEVFLAQLTVFDEGAQRELNAAQAASAAARLATLEG